MKVAFTILAHTQPEHLVRLVQSLNADWNEIYIHTDASSDIEPFISAVDTEDKPVFLRDNQRIHVNRSGYSTVEAILSLISTALESVDYYDRFCLLSGSDFPVKGPDDIWSMFVTDVEKEPDLPQYYLSNEHGCHYIDWNSRGVRLPKVLGAEDACKIYHSKALFARKFDYKKPNAAYLHGTKLHGKLYLSFFSSTPLFIIGTQLLHSLLRQG